jgi:hypothetical protein
MLCCAAAGSSIKPSAKVLAHKQVPPQGKARITIFTYRADHHDSASPFQSKDKPRLLVKATATSMHGANNTITTNTNPCGNKYTTPSHKCCSYWCRHRCCYRRCSGIGSSTSPELAPLPLLSTMPLMLNSIRMTLLCQTRAELQNYASSVQISRRESPLTRATQECKHNPQSGRAGT